MSPLHYHKSQITNHKNISYLYIYHVFNYFHNLPGIHLLILLLYFSYSTYYLLTAHRLPAYPLTRLPLNNQTLLCPLFNLIKA